MTKLHKGHDAILRILERKDGPMTLTEIWSKDKLQRPTIANYLRTLRHNDEVTKIKVGGIEYYSISSSESETFEVIPVNKYTKRTEKKTRTFDRRAFDRALNFVMIILIIILLLK